MSHTKARMIAEGATWLATGGIPPRDESELYGRVMNRFEVVLPARERRDWLTRPNEGLAGKSPMDFIDADELEPLEGLLDSMPEANHSGNGAG